MSDLAVPPSDAIPVGAVGRQGVGWWGMICVIVTEAALFAYLFFGFFYAAAKLGGNFMPPEAPSLTYALPGIIVLLLSSAAAYWAEIFVRQQRPTQAAAAFLIAAACGIVFGALQICDWSTKHFSIRSDIYGSMYYTITGLHLAHLAVGIAALLLTGLWATLGYFDARRNAPVLITAAYWQFVVAVGVAVFLVLNVAPQIG